MDGARQPQDLRRVRLDRLDLQGAAHRRARSRSWAIHGTTTKAIAIGHAVREAQRAPQRSGRGDPVDRAAARCCSAARSSTSTGARPRASCAARRGSTASTTIAARALELDFQNEWIVAWRDGEPVAMSPDLICVLDSVAGEAVGTETIRYGQRVTVIALPPPAGLPDAEGARPCRPARLRLRPRLPAGVRDETHRHRRRRHQHGCGADRGREGARRRQGADDAGRDRRHPRRARPPDGNRRRRRQARRCRHDRHDAFHQRRRAAALP